MLGAIIGDISGSFREFIKDKYPGLGVLPDINDLPTRKDGSPIRYSITDDTVLTIATMEGIIHNHYMGNAQHEFKFAHSYLTYGSLYKNPVGGYGAGFVRWLDQGENNPGTNPKPYNSCGNGSAMRVSPVAYYAKTVDECLELAFRSAIPTHNHPDGIKGAQATALAIFLARHGSSWSQIEAELKRMYLWYEPVEHLGYFDAICQDTMRLVNHVLGTTNSFEEAVLKAVTIPDGDSDTLGAIVGSIAEALYGIPEELKTKALAMMPSEMIGTMNLFVEIINR